VGLDSLNFFKKGQPLANQLSLEERRFAGQAIGKMLSVKVVKVDSASITRSGSEAAS
jgi:hypothetical protein